MGFYEKYYVYAAGTKAAVDAVDVKLNIEIDRDILQRAANSTVRRYPNFAVKPYITKANTFALKKNDKEVPVFEKGECFPLGTEKTNGYLFRISYDQNSIKVDIFHSLTDGMWMHGFTKTLLYYYLTEAGYTIDTEGIVLTNQTPVDATEDEDIFEAIPDVMPENGRKCAIFDIPEQRGFIDSNRNICYSIAWKEAELKKVCDRLNCSNTVFLIKALNETVRELYDLGDKSIGYIIPADIRSLCKSKSLRNYCSSIFVSVGAKDGANELNWIKESLARGMEENNLFGRVNVMRGFDGFFDGINLTDQAGMKAFRRENSRRGAGKATFLLSNIGKIQIPEDMKSFIEAYRVYTPNTDYFPLCSYERYAGKGVFKLVQNFESSRVADVLADVLEQYGMKIESRESFVFENDNVYPWLFEKEEI